MPGGGDYLSDVVREGTNGRVCEKRENEWEMM